MHRHLAFSESSLFRIHTSINTSIVTGPGRSYQSAAQTSRRLKSRANLKQTEVHSSSKEKIDVARKFYEGAWSATDAEELDKLIDSTIAEDHSQEDMVWQPNPRKGRDSIRNGIRYIRKIYPDARFKVDRAALTEDGSQVFVQWTMTGTYDGMVDATTGTSVLSIDGDLISRTQVYRQALRAEVEMARKNPGKVPQGAVLLNRES